MSIRKLSFLAIVLTALSCHGPLIAQGNLGQSGANFLQIHATPRGAALGGAVVAVSEGANALYWNPAGALATENLELSLNHTRWFMDTRLTYAGVVKRIGRSSAAGLSALSYSMDEMEITTVEQSEGTGEYFGASDLALGGSYVQSMTDHFTFGITVKYVQETIWNEQASQMAFDVGSLYRVDFFNLRLGMAVRNFAGKMIFEGENIDRRIREEQERDLENNPRAERLIPEFRLPQTFQLGIAFDPIALETGSLTLLADANIPSDNVQRMSFGAEYLYRNVAFLRGSYRLNYDLGQWALGGGVRVSMGGVETHLDYAFSMEGVLGNIHRIGVRFAL